MRWIFLMAIPGILFAQSYSKIIEDIDNAPALKSAHSLEMAAKSNEAAAKGKNLPSLDLSFSGAWLKDTPTVTFRIPGTPPMEAPMGTKRNFIGSLRLAYPIFTGYAISASVDKALFERKKAELKVLDLKRNLYLQATALVSGCYAADKKIEALESAKRAMEDAYKKAKGLYDNGLLPPSDLYNIEAKRYAVDAEITDTISQKEQLLNTLGYLLDKPMESVELPLHHMTAALPVTQEELIKTALDSREDIEALKSAINADRAVEKLAKSRLYPTVGLAAELKRRGDTPELNGDGFTNPDQSYVGAAATWNLFNGFADKKMIEAARYKRLASQIALNDYKNRVKMELQNAFSYLAALLSRLKSAKMELKARKAYCDLTRGRFENQLAGADELSRSIADLSAAAAKVSGLQSQIFNQKAKIWLMTGLKPFLNRFLRTAD